jgi:hypothetical protein
MKQIVYYRPLVGRDTKDVLRELTPADQEYIKLVMTCYKQLCAADPRPEYTQWFDMPNENLPRQTRLGGQRNSPRTFCDGIIEKLNQTPNRRDLSPRQCEGIEALSRAISEIYEQGLCPAIAFANKATRNAKPKPINFNELFSAMRNGEISR